RMKRFNPMMSVTEYIMVMSRVSTQGATLPEAMVETITFGKPYGSAHHGRAERRALGPAHGEDRLRLAGGDQLADDPGRPHGHDRRGLLARERPPQLLERRPPRPRGPPRAGCRPAPAGDGPLPYRSRPPDRRAPRCTPGGTGPRDPSCPGSPRPGSSSHLWV